MAQTIDGGTLVRKLMHAAYPRTGAVEISEAGNSLSPPEQPERSCLETGQRATLADVTVESDIAAKLRATLSMAMRREADPKRLSEQGFIFGHAGQTAQIKLETSPFTRYGTGKAEVSVPVR